MKVCDLVTVGVSAFERNDCLARCLDSIRRADANVPIVVVNDGRFPINWGVKGCRFFNVAFDIGVAAKRNIMLEKARTRYLLLMDDDFFLPAGFRIERMLEKIEANPRVDILGGTIKGRNRSWNVARLSCDDGVLSRFSGAHSVYNGLSICDMIPNFWIGRTGSLRRLGGWDERLKCGGEHLEFFFRAKRLGLVVASMKTRPIGHRHQKNQFYSKYLKRRGSYIKMMMNLCNLRSIVFDGRVVSK